MSLPPASKDISEHPQAGSVTAPTDKGVQAADVDRKVLLYGVIQAFRQGRMPNNSQIDKALLYLRDAEPVDIHKLSSDGKQLIKDSRDIIETARLIVKQKNPDELFQNFVWHTRELDIENVGKQTGDTSQIDPGKLTEDSRVAMRHLRTLLSLVLTNSEVRKLLSDFSVIGRDLLSRGASKVAEALRPDEALSGLDDPAAQGKPVPEHGQKVGTGEIPVLDVNIPHTDIHAQQRPHARESLDKMGQGGASGSEVHTHHMGQATQMRRQTSQTTESSVEMKAAVAGVSSDSHSEEEVEGKKRDFKELIKDVKDKIVPQGQTKRVSEEIRKGQHFLENEYFPAERRDQFIYRGKKVIVECQQHKDYQDAMKWLLSVAEQYAELGHSASEKRKETARKIINDPSLRQATSELRQLLERFANGQSMHIIFDSIGAICDDAHRDEEFCAWFKRLNAFIRKMLLEAGYVLEDDCSHEGREIRESGRKFWDQKYRADFDNVFNSIGDWFSAMGNDPFNKRFGEDLARFTRDLLFDDEGNLKFKSSLWSDIRSVIVPTLVDKIGYLPIPRIEYSDHDAMDLVLENLTLQGRNFFPNIVTVTAHNYLKFSPYSSISDEHHHEFTFTFAQMQADMRDVAFFFHKKTFPKVMDSGIADVIIGGSGLTAVVHLVSAGKDRSSVFKVKDVHVKVGSLKFSIRDSNHDLLYKTLKPVATRLVKRQIKRVFADTIRTGMEYLDGQLVSVRDRMEAAKSSDENRQELLELFKRHKEEQSIRSSESKSQLRVVSNKRLSAIDTGHPSGWVNRISESEVRVTKGEDWRSEAFTIV